MIDKKDIKNAAYELFAYKGFTETSTEDIAGALGLKKQSLYSHFRSKREIITAVLFEQSQLVSSELQETLEDLDDASFENILKGVFEKMIVVFSDETRIMFWKRIYMLDSAEFIDTLHHKEHFDTILYNAVFDLYCRKYDKEHDNSQSHAEFQLIYFPFTVILHGYINAFLIGHKSFSRENLWNVFVNGIKDKLRA